MIDILTTEIGEPTQEMLVDLRKHAAVADKSQDALLLNYLRKAIPMVQDAANVSLVPETIVLTVTEREDNEPVRLYKTVNEIRSVKDGYGNDLQYKLSGRLIYPAYYTREVVVTYCTQVVPASAKALLYDLSEYAANLYAGATPEEKAAQLRSI